LQPFESSEQLVTGEELESLRERLAAEVQSVVDAPDARAAAAIINWWHDDWSAIGDTPTRAARRIRPAAKRTCGQH
jgi:hypothetical protein